MKIEHSPELDALREELKPFSDLMAEKGVFTSESGLSYFSGYSYQYQYDWDLYFETLLQLYMGWDATYPKNGIKLFLDHQREDGFIARSVPSNAEHDNEHVKPFLAQTAMLIFDQIGEVDWLLENNYFEKLQNYLDYWLINMDGSDTGLSDWMSAPHTGMDTQHERAGYWRDRVSKGVDLNCYLVLECEAFAALAHLLEKKDLADEYSGKADELKQRIRSMMWDEEDGFFYDLNARVLTAMKEQGVQDHEAVVFETEPFSRFAPWGSQLNRPWRKWGDATQRFRKGEPPFIRVKTAAGLMPLWAGVATQEQAERLVREHLLNEDEFWSTYPVAVMSRSEPTYAEQAYQMDTGCSWRGNVWIPVNHMLYHGLKRYGFDE